jgi:hypothetical protein
VTAARWTIELEKDFPWRRTIAFKNPDGSPMNLEGYSARHQFKHEYGDAALFTLTPGAGITITAATGRVTVELSAAQVALFTQLCGVHNFSLIDPATFPVRELTGPVLVELT